MGVVSSNVIKARWSAFLLALAGCRDRTTTCNDYDPSTSPDASISVVRFSKDVMPIVGKNCAYASCHGSTAGSANGVYLGGSDPLSVHTSMVGKRSSELPSMLLVAPGKPHESFLMRKLDGSQCALDARCIAGNCGPSMPRGGSLLPLATRDTIRQWIAQGAKND